MERQAKAKMASQVKVRPVHILPNVRLHDYLGATPRIRRFRQVDSAQGEIHWACLRRALS